MGWDGIEWQMAMEGDPSLPVTAFTGRRGDVGPLGYWEARQARQPQH